MSQIRSGLADKVELKKYLEKYIRDVEEDIGPDEDDEESVYDPEYPLNYFRYVRKTYHRILTSLHQHKSVSRDDREEIDELVRESYESAYRFLDYTRHYLRPPSPCSTFKSNTSPATQAKNDSEECVRRALQTNVKTTSTQTEPETTPPCTNNITMDAIKTTIREEFQKHTNLPKPAQLEKVTQLRPSYSEQARKPAINIPRNSPAIVATVPDVQSSSEALKVFRHGVSFKTCTYAPSKIRPVGNNKLRIEFQNEKQRDETLSRLNSGGAIKAVQAKSLSPMVVLKGIHKDTPSGEIVDIITSQNPTIQEVLTETSTLQHCFNMNNRNGNLYNAVFKCSPSVWRVIMKLGRINIEHQRVFASEHSPFKQCLGCLQYGHTRTHCKATCLPCSHCAETTHNYKQCPNKSNNPPKCYNCINNNSKFNSKFDVNHTAINPNCSKMTAAKIKIHQRIDYGN